jgi:hypothetical protein
MKHQPSPRTLTVMSGREKNRSVRGRLLRGGAQAVPGADGASLAVSGVPAPNVVRKCRLRRLGDWLSAVMADDGVGARFAAERQRDAGLVRRVERRRRP